MAKLLQKYESMAVFKGSLSDDQIKESIDKFKQLIEKNATLEAVDEWGKRQLAYPIKDETEGYYVLFSFESKPDFSAELDRVYNINDNVIRTLIIAKV